MQVGYEHYFAVRAQLKNLGIPSDVLVKVIFIYICRYGMWGGGGAQHSTAVRF